MMDPSIALPNGLLPIIFTEACENDIKNLEKLGLVCKRWNAAVSACYKFLPTSELSRKILHLSKLSDSRQQQLKETLKLRFAPIGHSFKLHEVFLQKINLACKQLDLKEAMRENFREGKFEKLIQEIKAIDQELDQVSHAIPMENYDTFAVDWTKSMENSAFLSEFQPVAQAILFRVPFNQKRILQVITNNQKHFCGGLMVKLHYDLSQCQLSIMNIIFFIIYCKGLNFSDFVASGIALKNEKMLLDSSLIFFQMFMQPDSLKDFELNARNFKHPDLLPYVRRQPLTKDEVKELLLDLFTIIDLNKLIFKKISHPIPQFNEIIIESIQEFTKDIPLNKQSKIIYLKKIFNKIIHNKKK